MALSQMAKNEIKEACLDYCARYMVISKFEILNEDLNPKLRKLLNSLDIPGSDVEEIYMAYDYSIFKNGKDGFAINESGIHYRGPFEKYSDFISFKALAKAKRIYRKDTHIYADGDIIAYYSGSDSELDGLLELIKNIAAIARKYV